MTNLDMKCAYSKVRDLRAFAAIAPDVMAVVKEYDGKQFNKKFKEALREVKSPDGKYICRGYDIGTHNFVINVSLCMSYNNESLAFIYDPDNTRPWAKLIGKTERVNAPAIVESIKEQADKLNKRANKIEKQIPEVAGMIEEYNRYIAKCNNIYRELDSVFVDNFRYEFDRTYR